MSNHNACKECRWKKKCRSQCAQLPEGATCGDCVRFDRWCSVVLEQDAAATTCVMAPHKFEPKGGVQDE